MKRFLVLFFLFSPLYLSAANKMSMVTYFPVPYVAYSRINVSDQLDAGLTSACNMNLGCNESSVNLQVNTLNVKQYSKLDLNGGKGVWSNSMTLGSGSDNGRIAFSKVRIQGGTSRSINVKDTLNVPSLKLFESEFPDCKQAGGKDGTMSWTPLKLKGAAGSELYLACGEAGAGTCQPTDPRGARYTEDCPSGQTGTIIYTWNTSSCSYTKTNNCKTNRITCITSSQWKTHGLSVESSGSSLTCSMEPQWFPIYYTTDMVCGNETTHHSGYATWDELKDCEPGKYYLYVDTYGCRGVGKGCKNTAYGWWCLKCGTVDSESKCVQKSSITNMAGKHCSESGGGQAEITPITPGDFELQP